MSITEIQELTFEERMRLMELYSIDCERQGVQTTYKDFILWLEER